MRAKLLLAVCLLLLAGAASALSPTTMTIDVDVDKDGSAHIVETYKINFDSKQEIELFKQEAKENGSSLISWKVDEPWFFPRLADERAISKSFVSFDEGLRQVSLDYFIEGTFATKVEDAARETKWKISDQQLRFYSKDGLLMVPENVTITFNLPTGAVIATEQLSSKVKVVDNAVILSGISTNYLNLQYHLDKPIAPLNVFRLIGELLGTHLFLVLAVLLLVGVIAAYKREQIVHKIENYIITHSEIEEKTEEDEFEFED